MFNEGEQEIEDFRPERNDLPRAEEQSLARVKDKRTELVEDLFGLSGLNLTGLANYPNFIRTLSEFWKDFCSPFPVFSPAVGCRRGHLSRLCGDDSTPRIFFEARISAKEWCPNSAPRAVASACGVKPICELQALATARVAELHHSQRFQVEKKNRN